MWLLRKAFVKECSFLILETELWWSGKTGFLFPKSDFDIKTHNFFYFSPGLSHRGVKRKLYTCRGVFFQKHVNVDHRIRFLTLRFFPILIFVLVHHETEAAFSSQLRAPLFPATSCQPKVSSLWTKNQSKRQSVLCFFSALGIRLSVHVQKFDTPRLSNSNFLHNCRGEVFINVSMEIFGASEQVWLKTVIQFVFRIRALMVGEGQ